MMQEQTWFKLVKQAQQGHKEYMNQLAQEAKGRLCAYIYRVTLNHHLTQDLSQEVLLQMVKSINQLNKVERFWPWLYRIAQSKIQQHYKGKQGKTAISASVFSEAFLSQHPDHHQKDGLHQLLQKELSEKVMTAMKQIKQQYRAVLSLRCFEQLSYSDIAVTMQCSEVNARVLFYRAKQALKKQLTHQGLSKGLLLMCLGLFGRLTAPAKAASPTVAVTVTAASIKVGLITAVIAAVETKLGIATVTAAAVGLATVGGISILSKPPLPERNEVKSFHYTVQARNTLRGPTSSLSKGAYEQSYYFPDGIEGSLFMRMQRWNAAQKHKLCAWLQNGEGNYYYDSGVKKVYMNNYRLWLSSLRVRRLPSDTAELTSFLSEVEGDISGIEYARDTKTGLLVNAVDDRFVDVRHFRTNYNYNTLNDSRFQYNWSADIPVVDDRDQMHRRGWTYFRITGEMDGQIVSGQGQIPFVYNAGKEHPAWMTLNIGNELEIIDCNNGAYLRGVDGTLIAAYPAGTFFKGIGRPWMGMHTLDIVRRDAAMQRVWFKTKPARNKKDVIVTLAHKQELLKTNLIYTIDMENDIIEDIRLEVQNKTIGSITFSYLQDIEQVGGEFVEPVISGNPEVPIRKGAGILWLVYLAQGNLGK